MYLAVRGKVYDVTSGRNFYGPGGPYENFAGRDATRGLACQSFDEEMLTKNLDGPLDDCKDLEPEQLENLQGWIERFDEKVSRVCLLLCSGILLLLRTPGKQLPQLLHPCLFFVSILILFSQSIWLWENWWRSGRRTFIDHEMACPARTVRIELRLGTNMQPVTIQSLL